MLFRLYTSLELKAEAQRQGTQLWGEGFEFASAMEGMDTGATDRHPWEPIVVMNVSRLLWCIRSWVMGAMGNRGPSLNV